MRRTQLYLDEDQYRWLKRQAGSDGSIASVVRELIDKARAQRTDAKEDPLMRHLLYDPPARGRRRSSVSTIDEDLYG